MYKQNKRNAKLNKSGYKVANYRQKTKTKKHKRLPPAKPMPTPQYVIDYEVAHALPTLQSSSRSRLAYGRLSRYRYLQQSHGPWRLADDKGKVELLAYLRAIKNEVNAQVWVDRGYATLTNDLVKWLNPKPPDDDAKAFRSDTGVSPTKRPDAAWRVAASKAARARGLA